MIRREPSSWYWAIPIACAACSPEAGEPKAPPEGPFVVSEYYAASGAMGDGATPGNLVINEGKNCKERIEGARGSCYAFEYVAIREYETPEGRTGVCNWAGVFWQYPNNNWGAWSGLPIPATKLSKVSFVAAVAAGAEHVTFQIGGIGRRQIDPAPTDLCPPFPPAPPQYYDVISSFVIEELSPEWQRFEVLIKARYPETAVPDRPELLGAFSWAVAAQQESIPKVIYIDDLVYE